MRPDTFMEMDQEEWPIENFFLGKWLPEDNDDDMLVPACKLHIVRRLRRSKRVHEVTNMNATLAAQRNSAEEKQQGKKLSKLNKVQSNEKNKQSSHANGVAREEDDENIPRNNKNPKKNTVMKNPVVLSDKANVLNHTATEKKPQKGGQTEVDSSGHSKVKSKVKVSAKGGDNREGKSATAKNKNRASRNDVNNEPGHLTNDDSPEIGAHRRKRKLAVILENYDDKNDISWRVPDNPEKKRRVQKDTQKKNLKKTKSVSQDKNEGEVNKPTKKKAQKTKNADNKKSNPETQKDTDSPKGVTNEDTQEAKKKGGKGAKKGNKKEIVKPEKCEVTAKQGTLKYLQQRDQYLEASMWKIDNPQVCLSDIFGKKKKNKPNVNKLLLREDLDESLTITTPRSNKGEVDSVLTPRTTLMGMLAGGITPTTSTTQSTTDTPASERRRDAVHIVFQQTKNKGRPRGIRKAMQEIQSTFSAPIVNTTRNTIRELPTLTEEHKPNNGDDSSNDEYFDDLDELPSIAW